MAAAAPGGWLRRVERKRSQLSLRRNALQQEEITEEIEVMLRSAAVNALR